MEMHMYQRAWHGIDLTGLPAAFTMGGKPKLVDLYAQFYEALASGQGKIDERWLSGKRLFGEAIQRDLFEDWKRKNNRTPRILALAAGSGAAEGVWAERGCVVTFNECQEASLQDLRRRFPEAGFIVGDMYTLNPAEHYDIVTLFATDAHMDWNQMLSSLRRAASWLNPNGLIVIHCASVLSWRQFLRETIKRTTGYYRRIKHVFWGYWRTPGEFFSLARASGLRVANVYKLGEDSAGRTALRLQSPITRRLMAWRDFHLIITLDRKL